MRKSLMLFAGLILAGLGLAYLMLVRESADFVKFKQIRIGMSVDEVQVLLGPGTPVAQGGVPSVVRAVNPDDAIASESRARQEGRSPSTVRDYPVRHKPVVEGDAVLEWVNAKTRERILVAFKDEKVCETYYHDPNDF